MRRLYDFECQNPQCGTVFEELTKYEERESVRCSKCGSPTLLLIGTPTIDPRLGLDPSSFPTMGDKWAKIREQRKRIESKRTSYD